MFIFLAHIFICISERPIRWYDCGDVCTCGADSVWILFVSLMKMGQATGPSV